MKIGILSMQKIHNYGSFLQAHSLKKQLESRGHDVYFVDILPGQQVTPMPKRAKLLKKIDKYLLKRAAHLLMARKMAKIHIKDYETYLQTGKLLPEGQRFDLVVIGSDEVFSAAAPSPWGFTTQLFGDIPNADRVVSYAASCGETDYEAVVKLGIDGEIGKYLSGLMAVSVRDQNSAKFVQQLTGKEPMQHLDPVFISDFDSCIPKLPGRKPYLLVYAYANRIKDETEIQAIRDYAKQNGLETVSVGMYQRWCDRNITADAFELLAYVKGAACVVTDTFHGTVFSIKYNKKFATLLRDSNRNKLGNLLERFSLLDRSVDRPDMLAQIMERPIDFEKANSYIRDERVRSAEYLDQITNED